MEPNDFYIHWLGKKFKRPFLKIKESGSIYLCCSLCGVCIWNPRVKLHIPENPVNRTFFGPDFFCISKQCPHIQITDLWMYVAGLDHHWRGNDHTMRLMKHTCVTPVWLTFCCPCVRVLLPVVLPLLCFVYAAEYNRAEASFTILTIFCKINTF